MQAILFLLIILALFESSDCARERVNLTWFYPSITSAIRERPALPYGNEIDPLDAQVESITVEERIYVLKRMQGDYQPSQTLYEKHIWWSSFIDLRVFRLLVRFAWNSLEESQKHIRSATDIVRYIKSTYPGEDFSSLTPYYLMMWYNLLGTPGWQIYTFSKTEEVRKAARHGTGKRYILLIGQRMWIDKMILPRLYNLVKTGYDIGSIVPAI